MSQTRESGALHGTGSATRASRVSAWGRRALGRLAFADCFRLWRGAGYQAWVRAQWGQPTEVVTSASKA
jgi:hypothetical protein